MRNNARLRKPKVGQAVRAPRKVRAPRATGGTTAPAAAAKSGTTAIGQNRNLEKVGVGPGKKVPPLKKQPQPAGAGGPAPGAPEAQVIPESARTANERAEAASKYGLSEADIKHQIYLAALEYGDPTAVAQYGDAVETPGGALQLAAKEAGEARKANTLARGQNNTFFSGMNLEDIRHIGDNEALKKQQAKENWEKALWELTVALQEAQEQREAEENEASLADLEAFEASEPEPLAVGGGGGGGGKKGKIGKGKAVGGGGVPRTPLGGGTFGTGGKRRKK